MRYCQSEFGPKQRYFGVSPKKNPKMKWRKFLGNSKFAFPQRGVFAQQVCRKLAEETEISSADFLKTLSSGRPKTPGNPKIGT